MESEDWINLSEAAGLAGCSRKTLYRYMAKNRLVYHKAENNRRYLLRSDIENLFPGYRQKGQEHSSARADFPELVNLLERLSAEIKKQGAVLERMVALYQPKSLAELITKREKLPDD